MKIFLGKNIIIFFTRIIYKVVAARHRPGGQILHAELQQQRQPKIDKLGAAEWRNPTPSNETREGRRRIYPRSIRLLFVSDFTCT